MECRSLGVKHAKRVYFEDFPLEYPDLGKERPLLGSRFLKKFPNIYGCDLWIPIFPSSGVTDVQYIISYYFYQTRLVFTHICRERLAIYKIEWRKISAHLRRMNTILIILQLTITFSSFHFISYLCILFEYRRVVDC